MTYSTYYQFVHFIADSNKIQATKGSSPHLRTLKVKPMNPRILNQVIFNIFITCVIHNQIQCGKVIYLFILRFWMGFFFTNAGAGCKFVGRGHGWKNYCVKKKNGKQLKMCKTFCSSCLLIINLFTFKEYNKYMKIVIFSRTSLRMSISCMLTH